MKALLLAGGKGTRLWPLSQANQPKQIISPLDEEKNLLEMTIERTLELGFDSKNIFLITAQDQVDMIKPFWDNYKLNSIISEPTPKNTFPAILLGVKKIIPFLSDDAEPIYVFPSDQYIDNFTPNLALHLHDMILCFRIIPTRPETGYGYIQAHTGGIVRKVRKFTEKPNQQIAQEWYDSWKNDPEGAQEEKYFWNAGIYAFSLNSLKEALHKIDPKLCQFWLESSEEEFLKQYDQLPQEPFDIFVAEKAYNLHCVPLMADSWRDIGTWQSIYEALRSNDLEENIHIGKGSLTCTSDTKSCLVRSDQDFHVACAGVEDLAVIIKDNKILITKKNKPQAIQELIHIFSENKKDLL